MTRAEYEAKYGSTPILLRESELDNEPVFSAQPIQMTREQYNAKYGLPSKEKEVNPFTKSAITFKPLFPAREDDGILETGLKAAGNVVPSALNLGMGLIDIALNPIDTAKSIFSITKGAGERLGREVLEQTPLKDRVDEVEKSENEQAFEQLLGFVKDNYYGTENLQRTITNDPFGTGIDILGLLTGGATLTGKLNKATGAIDAAVDAGKVIDANTIQKAKGVVRPVTRVVQGRADEIRAIESNYTKTRKVNDVAPDADASRQRIAATDVLINAVDENGLIRTTQKGGAVEQYRKLTVDGYENVVRQLLEREGKDINLNEVKGALVENIYSTRNLEGADLISALRRIDREIQGLAVHADEFGNIPLYKIHDAKIASTINIDYTKPLSQTYRKTVGNTFKRLVEDKSQQNIKEINSQLGNYYQDIERLRNLDGRRVQGGKLGKYFAQVTGNVAGAAAGSVAGPFGIAAGTVIGGEVSSALKGKTLAKTFGKELGLKTEKNAILETARKTGTLPLKRDLKVPDMKVGAAKGIPKTPEITRLESLIDRNIKEQKAAIKAKDYTLVSQLKDVYNTLVERLVQTIKKVKQRIDETPNKEGGFIANPAGKKNNNKTYFHSTNVKAAQQIKKKGFESRLGANSEGVTQGEGVWLYPDRADADAFGPNIINRDRNIPGSKKKSLKTEVVETQIEGEVFQLTDNAEELLEKVGDPEFIEQLKKEGYVGVSGKELGQEQIFIFEPDAIKVKES